MNPTRRNTDTDAFGYPLRAAEQLHVMQGGKLEVGENSRATSLPSQKGNDLNEVGEFGFSRREWLDAQFELYCFNLRAGMTASEAREEV